MRDALLKETKTKLLDLIKVHGEVSVDEATKQLGLAKTTVRQHLLLLERQGLIQRDNRKASKGRPLLIYRLTENATQLFPSLEPQLLKELLSRLIADGNEGLVLQFFREHWEQRTKKFRDRLQARGTKTTAREVLFEMLEEDGFMPEIEEEGDSVIVRECNCPFSEAIKATRIPCRLEAEFLTDVLKMGLERVSYIPSGEPTCTYVLKAKKKRRV